MTRKSLPVLPALADVRTGHATLAAVTGDLMPRVGVEAFAFYEDSPYVLLAPGPRIEGADPGDVLDVKAA